MSKYSSRLSITISTAITSFISLFSTTGIAQDYPICFMITSSGQVVNLNKLCQRHTQSQAVQKVTCQEPLNNNGVPIAYANELERLKKVFELARNGSDYGSLFLESQLAMIALLEKTPLSENSQRLLQEQKLLLKQMQTGVNPEENQELFVNMMENFDYINKEFERNPCYETIMEALNKKLK